MSKRKAAQQRFCEWALNSYKKMRIYIKGEQECVNLRLTKS